MPLAPSLNGGKGLGDEFQMAGGVQDPIRSDKERVVGDANTGPATPVIHRLEGIDQTYRPPVGQQSGGRCRQAGNCISFRLRHAGQAIARW